ncbi:MAG: chromate transporter [Desulfurococcaceae archaeon]
MVSYLDLFLVFLKLGFLLFGGAFGGVGLYYKVFVEERAWLTPEEYSSIIGVVASLPGPITVNAAAWIGFRMKGIVGSIIAVAALIAPGVLLVLGAIHVIRLYIDHWITKALLRGVVAAVIALILYALVGLANSNFIRKGVVDWVSLSIFVLASIVLFTLKLNPVFTIAISAVVSILIKVLTGF